MLKAGVRPTFKVGRHRGRKAPVEFSDACEVWARGHGGHATLKWLENPMNCWAVVLKYRTGDPRQQIESGPEADGEPVLLHDWKDAKWWENHPLPHVRRLAKRNRFGQVMDNYYAYDLDELGVEGILERLNRGNILSGRGEFKSAEHAGEVQREKRNATLDRERRRRKDDAGHRALDLRRSLYKIPYLPIGISIAKDGGVTKEK